MSLAPAANRGPMRRRAKRLPKDTGMTAWYAVLDAPEAAKELEDQATADWLIIGAGFAGLAAARRLRQLDPSGRIVVLEASRVGLGPTGRNSGFMIDLPHNLQASDYGSAIDDDREQIQRNRAAIAFAGQAVADYGLSDEAFVPWGKVNAAASEAGDAHNRSYGAHLAALGEDSQWLDAADMRAMTGSDYYRSGLYTPGTVLIQPVLYARGLAEGLQRQAVQIYENSPVVALERAGNSWKVCTPRGQIQSPRVIMAVNGHANSFGLFKQRLIHIMLYASMSAPLDEAAQKALGGQDFWGITPSDPMGSSLRRVKGSGGHRLLMRNRFSYEPSLAVDEAKVQRLGLDHDLALERRFPMLAGLKMQYRWAGRLCLSWNSAPAFGEAEPGLFSAVCQNGLGSVQGTMAGMGAAELAAGQASEHARGLLAAPSPSLIPPEPLSWIGASAALRWKEWRAGPEL